MRHLYLFALALFVLLSPALAFAQDVTPPPFPSDVNNLAAWLFCGTMLLSFVAAALPSEWPFTQWLRRAVHDLRGAMPKRNGKEGGYVRLEAMASMALLLAVLVACAGLLVSSCGLFERIDWPAKVKCAPSPQTLLDAVTGALSSGDYLAELERLALEKDEGAVVCAVRAVLDDLSVESASTGDDVMADRARVFLSEVGTEVE